MGKLFGKKKEEITPEHKALKEAVDKVFKDTKPARDKMSHNLLLYEGGLWNKGAKEFEGFEASDGPSTVQYNTVFANIQQIAPMVTANRPTVNVAPRFPYMWKLGQGLNHVIKYSWEAFDMQMLCFKGVVDSMIFGIALFHPDYREGRPVVELTDPRTFFIAPGYELISEAPWCGTRGPRPLSWVRREFPHVKEIDTDVETEEKDKARAYKFGDTASPGEDAQFVTVTSMWIKDEETLEEFEVEDEEGKKTKKSRKKFPYAKMCYFTETQWLGEKALEDRHGKPPWIELWDYLRPHNFLSMGELDQTEGLHREINILMKYISEYIRLHHAPNFMADLYQLEDTTLEQLKAKLSLGNQIIPWNSQGGQKDPPLKQITEGQLNPQISMWLGFLMEIIDIVSGVTDPQRGMVGKKERQPATETAILKEAADTRVMQRSRNLEWSLKHLFKMLLSLVMQHQSEPLQMSYTDNGARTYATYGNSFAQAKDVMTPQPLNASASAAKPGMPMVGTNDAEKQRYDQEVADYEKFMDFFTDEETGEPPKDFDPIGFDFDIEVGTDSTLPKDRQSRSNLFFRLRELQAIDILSLLEELQVPNAAEIVKRIQQEMGGGAEGEQAAKAANPEAAAKYEAMVASRRGG